ncbi:hypothetical protein GCM10022409_21030 [Hymenobacter glaciei]|uniref:Heparinase II/III-like C-terminal domain-containing protein n=1 Tax=Hymenobacter glaciei TaxID=877209 RepID=A0ABP7U4G6_9BACT
MKKSVALALALVCAPLILLAQAGSWNPSGADLAYPRTLLKAAALPGVRASLSAPDRLGIYQGLWNDVQAPPPTDNTSAAGRRARATYAKNAAFVVLLGQQPSISGLVALPGAARATLVADARGLLESINTDVEVFATPTGATPYTEWQWRSKELIDYLVAYDLLRGAGETPADLTAGAGRLQAFAGHLYQQSVTPMGPYSFYANVKNNHTLMTAAALGLAAVVLNEATSADATQQPATWAGTGLYHLDNVLWRDAQRQSDSTQVAGYAEGPYYLKYALLNCLPLFRAMGNFLPDGRLPYTFGATTRSIRNPYFDPKYGRLYEWLTAIRMPDGRFPALEDSYVDMGMPELALTGQARYVQPMYFSKLTGTGLASLTGQLRDITVDMRAGWLAAAVLPTAPAQPALTVLPASGNLVFRSGNDSLATYLHVYGRGGLAQTNAGGHSQGDASSFILHARGQLLALDPGYLSYARRAEVGQAANHNLVLVDGAGPAIGTPGAGSPAQSAVQHAFQTPQLAYGEVTTAYMGATITRKTLFIRNEYFLLADAVQATAAHTYTWQLHGYGLQGGTAATGLCTPGLASHEASWQKNGAGLLAHVTATGGTATYATATNPHETTYNTAENHTTLLVQQPSALQTQFLAALYPYTTASPQVATTSQATTAALATTSAGFIDVAFAQADSVLSTDGSGRLPQAVSADGLLNLYSATASGAFAQLFMQGGTVLLVGATPVLQSAQRATLSWQRTGATSYAGYASRATTLNLAMGSAPAAVTGSAVTGYTYDVGARELQVVLAAAGSFEVFTTASQSPLPVVLVDFTGKRAGNTVLLAWHTASEQQSLGFEVQRMAGPDAAFTTLGFVASTGAGTAPASYAFGDALAPSTLVYYRLRQVDRDGAATYSPVVAVRAATVAEAPVTLLPAFPQPARHVLTVALTGPAQNVGLRLFDSLGREVARQHGHQPLTELDVSQLMPGLYYLVAHDANGHPLPGRQKIVVGP